MFRVFYILRQTYLILKETKKVAVITVISLFVGMVALGSTYVVGSKLFQSSLSLREKVHIVVFFKQNLLDKDVERTVSAIKAIDGVKEVKLTTPEEGKDEFLKVFPQYNGLINSLDRNPIPYSLTVELSNIGLGGRIADVIKGFQTVDVVVFSEDIARKIDDLIKTIYIIFISVLLAVLGEFVFTIQNSTTLLLDFRNNDIRVLRLVGADSTFTFLPYIINAMFLNFISWLFSSYVLNKVNVLSTGIVQGIIPYATVVNTTNIYPVLFGILLLSIFTSFIGSILSILRFRDVK